ncbi:hypothetical protein KQX54_017224 [Cotesia glomerata]|uniref:Uncharacterized protein n=1 Tax=Cotesia glomerata TaxID=32391 RepID=A0AAV7ICS4_COTGL|nr:hypothetical protein KQX54_017224 [Cotesia glomerata]
MDNRVRTFGSPSTNFHSIQFDIPGTASPLLKVIRYFEASTRRLKSTWYSRHSAMQGSIFYLNGTLNCIPSAFYHTFGSKWHLLLEMTLRRSAIPSMGLFCFMNSSASK